MRVLIGEVKVPSLNIAVKIAVLFVVLFYSAGFTTIVTHCSMSNSSDCCCRSGHANDTSKGGETSSVSRQMPSCFSVKLAGGLPDTKATVIADYFSMLEIGGTAMLQPSLVADITPVHSFLRSSSDDLAPPRMDIRIGVSSLLI